MLDICWIDIIEIVFLPIVLAILAPWITKRWQDKQRELDIKTEFVSEISEAVMKTVMTIDVATKQQNDKEAKRKIDCKKEELSEAYKEWEVARCIISSKIHAYYPGIKEEWEVFSQRVTTYYECKWYGEELTKECEFRFKDERHDMLEEKANIIWKILNKNITGFRHYPDGDKSNRNI